MLNRVHCKSIPQKGYTGNRVLNCTINYESFGYQSCTATTTLTQAAGKTVMTNLQTVC